MELKEIRFFNHPTNTDEDYRFRKAVELMGLVGYAYYFKLIECVSFICSGEYTEFVYIHRDTLKRIWMCNGVDALCIIKNLEKSDLIQVIIYQPHLKIKIHDLGDYLKKI